MTGEKNMKISIITPSLNHSKFITDTILSVTHQNYNNYEHIVIDGGSTDGTIEILKLYSHLKWVSERDTGQSNAINKGFRMSTGDIVAWINSDDYYEKDVFADVAAFFKENRECYFLYGDITFVDKNKKLLSKISGDVKSLRSLMKNPDIVRQPSCFWRREIFEDIGYLAENLHLVMDYDFFLRIAKKYKLYYLKRNISYYRVHDECKTSKYKKKQNRELRRVMGDHLAFSSYLFCRFILSRHFNALKCTLANFKKRKFMQ